MNVIVFFISLTLICVLSGGIGYEISTANHMHRIDRAIHFLDLVETNGSEMSQIESYMYSGALAGILYFIIRDHDINGWKACIKRYDHSTIGGDKK